MFPKIQLGVKYFRYWFYASNSKGHGIHSPFVFNLIKNVLNDEQQYPEYLQVEGLRSSLRYDKNILSVEDLGAGSLTQKSKHRTIGSIARNAAKPARYGQLLFRMIRHFKSKSIIEAGTSLGITTSYLSMANPGASIISLEGAEEVADIAIRNFEKLHLKNIKIIKGNFDVTLSEALNELPAPDFVFIDGNHRKEPTINYFEQILAKAHNDTIIVFDDIHWSEGMEEAWKTICQNPAVTVIIDLFFIGIVFFRKENKEKQHFFIRF
ncbi:MAG: class I SAM-dependent methyltransferase [Chitinophagaceae bacterium]|jgi:predicted O-methyltransferase YrrM|nr:class I SAM-dependent methyltransferase [Chitinophagaceae bacterium]